MDCISLIDGFGIVYILIFIHMIRDAYIQKL